MPYDATQMKDWQISEAAEKNMPTPREFQEKLGLQKDEILPMGRLCKLDFLKISERLKNRPDGKYIEVTAITPTPLGEGKSTTSCGLMEGLGKRGKNVGGALRQPSGGPTMNIKGTAAGGGNSLLIPMTEFSMGLTGDINDIMNAHNLAMVAMTSRMQHERNYNDEQLQRLTQMRRLDIDPTRVEMGWIMDFCAQSLRNIIIGIGGRTDGFMMQSKFGIAVGSECMAILSIINDLADLKKRLNNITVAFDKRGKPVTTGDLEVGNAMTAFMRNTINPTLMCTAEYQPCMVHAGPFANIAVGQSSIIADRVGLKLFDYHVTESGFAADIGFEKFWNVKCRLSGLKPNVAVLVATVRALKMHGGGPKVVAGKPLAAEYTDENLPLLRLGLPNMARHIKNALKYGVNVVVAVNSFSTDTPAEVEVVRQAALEAGAMDAIVSTHWADGGAGAIKLAEAVIRAADKPSNFKFLYPLELSIREKLEIISKEIYGAAGVEISPEAQAKIDLYTKLGFDKLPLCMAKTHLSFTADASVKGAPVGFTIPVRDIRASVGAGFLYPLLGKMSTMPGLPTRPVFYDVDLDLDTGKVLGLF
jgi:formyltetrahydrofolate synthetase